MPVIAAARDRIAAMKVSALALVFLLLTQFTEFSFSAEPVERPPTGVTPDTVTPRGFPSIGKWMLAADMLPAHWLGERYYGKQLREPVNVIVIDGLATSAEDAIQRLITSCKKAGYDKRRGHTGGYRASLGDRLFGQLPGEKDHAFSDAPFELNNNHGRFFGPLLWNGKYYFIGAFSREKVEPLSRIKHQYLSFNQARDHFADAMDKSTSFRMTGFVDLHNTVVDHADITTGDHDGVAVVLSANKQ